jgi:hypothetical protein
VDVLKDEGMITEDHPYARVDFVLQSGTEDLASDLLTEKPDRYLRKLESRSASM